MLRREESISMTLNTAKEFTPSRFRFAPWHHFFSSSHWSDWSFSICIPARFCCCSLQCLSPAKSTPERGTKALRTTSTCVFPVPSAAGTAEDSASARLGEDAPPKTGGEQLLPRATFLPQIVSTLHWNSCSLWPKIFWTFRGVCRHFGMLRGAVSIFIFGCLTRRVSFLKEEVLRSYRGLSAFVGKTESLQRVEITDGFCWFI